jgi:hypothetical protein
MYRLGLQLTLRSGREPFVRLLITAAAVAIGVAIMLCVLADFHAFRVTSNLPSWESTQGHPVTRTYTAARNAELWNYSNDIYRSQTIERLDVAALGPRAPVPPGISRLPSAGQYYASPALARLIATVPANQLSDRFPGKLAGTIGQQALTGPDELVIYVGYQPHQLAGLSATTVVSTIATAPGRQVWTSYFRDAFIVGAIAFVFPILILVGTATRLAAARREERYAALRLVGATSQQISVISSVDAIVSALLGVLAGIGIFALFQPVLADTAITSERYFADQVTPTAAGYLVVLIAVPVASAIASLMSLRRVRISPLGVSRRVTPPAPTWLRTLPLLVGVALFLIGLDLTSTRQIGAPLFPGLIIILIGLVVAGPWLTAQAARLLRRVTGGASAVLATRRLGDNPRVAFRSVSGLVLAVFLGTLLAGLLPAVDKLDAGPSATAVNNILLDGFTSAPVCGNNVNCSGNIGPAGATALQQRIALEGLPPQSAAALLRGLSQISGATTVPVYSTPQTESGRTVNPNGPGQGGPGQGGPGPEKLGPPPSAVISCAGLRVLAGLGQCAPGRGAVQIQAGELFDDNPQFSTQPLAGAFSPAASDNFSGLYLQALMVKVNSPATLERVRTYLVTHTAQSASGTAPRTFGEAIQARAGVAQTVQRLIYIAVALTIIVAGCSLAVAVSGSMIERKRPFTLLRLTGTSAGTLYRVVLLEALLPLLAATIVAIGIAYGLAVLTVSAIAPAGTPTPVPGQAYYVTMAAGLAGSLLIILASLPLLSRVTGPERVRFE